MKKYGFYSEQYVKLGHPTFFWETHDGNVVETCIVTEDKEAISFKFIDKKPLGEVIRFVGQGNPDQFSTLFR